MKTFITSLTILCFSALGNNGWANPTSNANVQLIHNCADPAADSVDVYLNGSLAKAGFAFRTATPFLQLPAGVSLNVVIAKNHSMSHSGSDSIAGFVLGPLTADSNYIVVASGVVGSGFAANPSSVSTAFDLKVITGAETAASNMAKVDFAVFHGCTDAPAVDVNISNGGGNLVSNAKYGDHTGYLSVAPTWYPIDLVVHGTTTIAASYVADLSGLTGGAGVVLASGFLNPSANNSGPAFGLYLALPTGGNLIKLPAQQFSKVQVIHNCADPAADSVDVYVDGTKAIPNFKFRTATPFISLLSSVNHTIAVAPANSVSVSSALATFPNINLAPNVNYVVTASGVVGNGFAANPEGRSTAFTLLVKDSVELHAASSSNFDFFAIHGSTDAPTVRIAVEGVGAIISAATYKDQSPNIPVPASSYILDVQDSTGNTTIVKYAANLTGLADSSGVILASGFLTPSANNNGPAFGLYVALPGGGALIPLSVYTGINSVTDNGLEMNISPNPTNGTINLKFAATTGEKATIDLLDMSGKLIRNISNNVLGANALVSADISDLANGTYLVRVLSNEKVSINKVVLLR